MDLIDFIKELRSGRPEVKKTTKAMKIMGWISVVISIGNVFFYRMGTPEESPIPLVPENPVPYIAGIFFSGLLFFISANGIRQLEPWGKRAGQLAIGLFVGIIILSLLNMFSNIFPLFRVVLEVNFFYALMASVFFVLFFLQLILPAYFGIRYLDRLPTRYDTGITHRYGHGYDSESPSGTETFEGFSQKERYHDSPFPISVHGTFVLWILVPVIGAFIALRLYEPGTVGPFLAPLLFLIIFGPVLYNYLPSPFQKQRRLVTSFTGGGSIFPLNGSWPFFRLLVYEDAIEVRIMFHRYLIPYNRMKEIPRKVRFFNRGILIESNLPGVPSRIRFQGFGMKRLTSVINDLRDRFIAGCATG